MTILQTATFLLTALNTVMAFASWVLASISIRQIERNFGSYFSIDPAFIVCGVLANFWFLSIIVFGKKRTSIYRTKSVISISTFFLAFYFALAVAYSVRFKKSYYSCTGQTFAACGGMRKALVAFAWVDFIFVMLYQLALSALAGAHNTLSYVSEDGMNTPVKNLFPPEPKGEKAIGAH